MPQLQTGSDGFQTDLFTGSAGYTIPIVVPPGTNGVEPKLALFYNSDRGNGWIGQGWDLRGLGSIERSTRKGTPTYTNNDTYTLNLNGATYELVCCDSSGYYHTQIESFLRIQLNTAGNLWTVTDTGGIQYRFGANADSNVAAIRTGGGTRAWMLDRVTDTHGTFMDIAYFQDTTNGGVYPSQIIYSKGNGLACNSPPTSCRTVDFVLNDPAADPRPDILTSYRTGSKVTMNRRLKQISVKINGAPVRSYNFSYSASTWGTKSLLASVQEAGADGTSSFPPTTLQYEADTLNPSFNTIQKSTPPGAGNVLFGDVNQDGKADLLYLSGSTWYYYPGQGASWGSSAVPMGNPDYSYSNVKLGDVNGDGLPDLMWASSPITGTFNLYYAINQGGTWGVAQLVTTTTDQNFLNAYLVDINGDGRADLVWKQVSGNTAIWNYILNQGGSAPFSGLPQSLGFSTGDGVLADINGDGLPDLVSSDGLGNWSYNPNLGGGVFGTAINLGFVTQAFGISVAGFADMNGDGFDDLIFFYDDPGLYNYPTNRHYYYSPNLNGTLGGSIPFGSLPNCYYIGSSPSCAIDPSLPAQILADVNGDGRADFIRGDLTVNCTNCNYFIWSLLSTPSTNGPGSRLSQVTNPMGGSFSISYVESSIYSKWVVASVTQNDGLGNAFKTDYSYTGGKYVGYPYREFRGFNTVTVTDPPDQNGLRHYSVNTFFQDDYQKGKIQAIQNYNSAGTLVKTTTYTYAANSVISGVFRSDLSQETVTMDDINSPSKTISYSGYDAYGQATVVTLSGTNVASHVTTNNFLYNTTAYIVNRLYHTATTVNTVKTSESWFNYDLNANGINPAKGDLTQETRWLAGGTNPVIQYSYDVFGNRNGIIDARGNLCSTTSATVKYTYDSIYQTFPVTETDALCYQTLKTYWGVNTSLSATSVTGSALVPGLLATVTDPNGLRTDSYWDGLSRQKAVLIPPDTAAAPTTVWNYGVTGTAPNLISESKRVNVGGGTLDKYSYQDGFGRTIQKKSMAKASGTWSTIDTFYNSRGLTSSISIPYLTTSGAWSSPQTQPATTTTYDYLRRPLQITNPDGTFKQISYSRLVETWTDENSNSRVRTYDPYGRLITVQEPAGGGITNYTFDNVDSAGNIFQTITDDKGNVTRILFDTLGRKIQQRDPDLGQWFFSYDPNGNLLGQVDNKGQIVSFFYDPLNRIRTKSYVQATPPTVSTGTTSSITASTVTLNGTVNPNGLSTTAWFEYGITTSYGSSTVTASVTAGITPVAISSTIGGLLANTAYHFRIDAANNGGTSYSPDATFTTLASPPVATTAAATGVASTAATLNGTVNPNGVSVTAWFEYGVTNTYGTTTSIQAIGAGSTVVPVSTALSGLFPNTTYHFRFGANNSAGTRYGLDVTFTTLANPPTVTSGSAASITSNGATLNGTVNPHGVSATAWFEYGTTTAYVSTTATQALAASSSAISVSAVISGISPNTAYHFRIDAANNGGTSYSADATFTTLASPPVATTAAATGVASTAATLNGTVNPNNSATTAWFEYGITNLYGSSTSVQTIAAGSTAVPVSAAISGLFPNTTYHFRIDATNSAGTGYGHDFTFTTLANPPTVTSGSAASITSNGATLNGTVNPHGVSATAWFEYGTTTAYGSTTATQALAASSSAISVSAVISGISPNTAYHFRIDAANNGGTSYSPDATFTTLASPPVATTAAPTGVASTAATLNGTVNPNNSVTTAWFEYGITNLYGSSTPVQSIAATMTAVSVTASITVLQPNTTYHFRIDATNNGGTSRGLDLIFTTLANLPTVTTGSATGIGINGATLNGTVNPNGVSATAWFEYGTTTAYGSNTAVQSLAAGNTTVSISAAITGLTASTLYHFRIDANNNGGTSQGSDATFTTLGPPIVTTMVPTNILQNTATLNSTVNPNGIPATAWFEYGITNTYGVTTATQSLTAGTTAMAVSAGITGLSANTTYHFRIDANNTFGASYGLDGTFTTLAIKPGVETNMASSISQTGATLNGYVNPNGVSTLVWFEYGLTNAYGSSTATQSFMAGTAVSGAITGLTANTTYHFRIDASNSGGTSNGIDRTFTTLP